jgi:hypothetical protein
LGCDSAKEELSRGSPNSSTTASPAHWAAAWKLLNGKEAELVDEPFGWILSSRMSNRKRQMMIEDKLYIHLARELKGHLLRGTDEFPRGLIMSTRVDFPKTVGYMKQLSLTSLTRNTWVNQMVCE